MSVALRCPNCGTTRATPGECDACHEAQVRYFCTNHTPGLWLDGPACPRCGALFGDAAPRSRPPAPAVPTRPRSLAPARVSPTSSPAVVEEDFDASPPLMPLWQKLLRDAARARDMARRAAPSHETRSLVRGASGCAMRVVLLMVLLFVALVTLLVVFGGALLQGFF